MVRKTGKRYEFDPDYAVAPGATLQETIDSIGMTQRALALRTGMAAKTINEIIKGKAPITPDTSILLERVTGVPARMWNNLETNYREQLAQLADQQHLKADFKWLRTIPTKELIHRGVIADTNDKMMLLRSVLQFFGVASSAQWNRVWMQPAGAFRMSDRFKAEPGAIATWLRLGELQAQVVQTKPYDEARFRKALGQIRKLTVAPCDVFQPKMIQLAASAGVAVAFIRKITKCPVSGVARWLAPEKALIQLSLRYKTDDQFWFSFFHEAGHILNDPKKEVHIDDGDNSDNDREDQANRFAGEFLIPPEHHTELVGLRTRGAIARFAESIGIAPGIVVGRLQKERRIPWRTRLNSLKRSFDWKSA